MALPYVLAVMAHLMSGVGEIVRVNCQQRLQILSSDVGEIH
jgi:hypothetical protein